MSSTSLSVKFHNLKFLNEMIKHFGRKKIKRKRHDKIRDSCRVKSRETSMTESYFEVAVLGSFAGRISFFKQMRVSERVPTFAVSTFTNAAQARELFSSTNKRRKITRMENSLSSVSSSRAKNPARLSETRRGPFCRENFTSREITRCQVGASDRN